MAAKFGRGATLQVASGTATEGILSTTGFATIEGLGDTTINTGEPQKVDATNHQTPNLGTREIVTHMAVGNASAAMQWDGSLSGHRQIIADQQLALLKTFRLHDSTSSAPGYRWTWNGYYVGTPVTLPVSGLATGQLSISVEAGWVYEADV